MRIRQIFSLCGLISGSFLVLVAFAGQTRAQAGGPNPTPIVITLTPELSATPDEPTAVPSPTGDGSLSSDRFEPNDDPNTATEISWQTERGLTLIGDDVDYFTGYLKAGQMIRASTFVYGGLDTRLKLYWQGQLAAENDDRSPSDVGSTVIFTAPADGWYVALVEKVTIYDGVYDLETTLAEPTTTPTAAPTLTPTPTPTATPSPTPMMQPDLAEPNNTPETAWPATPGLRGTYTVGAGDVDYFTFIAKAGSRYACETVTEQVDTLLTVAGISSVIGVNDDRSVGRVDSHLTWTAVAEQPVVVKVEARGGSFGQYEFVCQQALPSPMPPPPALPMPSAPVVTARDPLTPTASLTTTGRISLTVQHVGQVQPPITTPTTHIRLLVYYDANNDRQPGPGEGIANVSVLAVNVQGQPIARIFTNAQGEAIFNLASEAISRVIVPFVPGWSARVRVGEVNSDIVLGLPAVRLPVFLPVQNRTVGEE
ncbi:MAG TPA: hypothetical protein PLD25_32755 [Chloroflexota bacterium]|nr:hypothetical protein [Chloroflexota bacterium]HUM70518.1 hypothetical protein [Chloroflexota bacterium]